MAKPIASFAFEPTGLSVQFTDSSSGVPTAWNWTFGFTGGGSTSTSKNPTVAFPSSGVYGVTLIVSNSEGVSDPYTFYMVISEKPELAMTIAEMVACETPVGLVVDSICFTNSIQKWMLYLQHMVSPKISDADVYNEAKWPPLVRVLISKLIIYDIILAAAKSSMTSYYIYMKSLNANNNVTTRTIQVADYTYILPANVFSAPGNSLTLTTLLVNGVNKATNNVFTSFEAMITWLNSLGIGNFYITGTTLSIQACSSYISTIAFTHVSGANPSTGVNGTFTISNVRAEAINQVIEISGTTIMPEGAMGSIKSLETGPSKTEWYDGSSFWASMFKSLPGTGENPGGGGIFENIVRDICQLGQRLRIRLAMCKPLSKGYVPFVIGSVKSNCGCHARSPKPPSVG